MPVDCNGVLRFLRCAACRGGRTLPPGGAAGTLRQLLDPSRALCPDEDDVEARCMLAFSLLIGNHCMAADHGARSRSDVLKLAIKLLETRGG